MSYKKIVFNNGETVDCCNPDCKSGTSASQCRMCGFELKESERRRTLPLRQNYNGLLCKRVGHATTVYARV